MRMKEGLCRILGGRAGRALLGVCAAAAVVILVGLGLAGQRGRELTEEELAAWQEKLETPAYRGFLTRMYADVRYLPLDQLLRGGAGLSRPPDAEELAAWPEAAAEGMAVISAGELEAYLETYTGLAPEDFSGGPSWHYGEAWDAYCFARGEDAPAVTVVSGRQRGDTVWLELAAEEENSGTAAAWGVPWENPTLTLEGGRPVSFANALYAAVEAMALEYLAPRGGGPGDILELTMYCAGQSDAGETYSAWTLAYLSGEERGEAVFLVRADGENPIRQVETADRAALEAEAGTLANYLTGRLLYGLEAARWPADADMDRDLGTAAGMWMTRAEDVIRGYLLSYGDQLEDWREERVLPSGEAAVVWAAGGGRQYTLLLNRRSGSGGAQGWQVLAAGAEGEPLPAQRGSSGREAAAALPLAGGGTVTGSLCQGGGMYGVYAWSLYIPDAGWRRDAQSVRWYPDSGRLDTYLEIRTLEAGYPAEVFYLSYENQFGEVMTNEGQEGVTLPWALGVQEGRRSESFLYQGETAAYEVLWTYGGDEEERGELLRAAAETFRPVDGEGAWEKGLLQDTAGRVRLVREEAGGEVPAGTYLVLRSGAAFSLEDCFAPYAREWRDRRNTVSPDYRYGEIRIGEIRLLDTWSREGALPVQILAVDWGIEVEPADDPNLSDGMYIDGEGVWHCGFAVYLVVEHDRDGLTRSFVLVPGDSRPGSAAFTGQLLQVLEGEAPEVPVTRRDGPPDAWYDRVSGRLTAP